MRGRHDQACASPRPCPCFIDISSQHVHEPIFGASAVSRPCARWQHVSSFVASAARVSWRALDNGEPSCISPAAEFCAAVLERFHGCGWLRMSFWLQSECCTLAFQIEPVVVAVLALSGVCVLVLWFQWLSPSSVRGLGVPGSAAPEANTFG
eukprot:8786863-Alexandrium_andersonii.AAC.1